jgi:hypothetical protein
MKHGKVIWILSSVAVLAALLLVGYAGWNASNPQRTCASCHEIVPSTEIWQQSAHREVTCTDCHGTALGNGFHSMKKRTGMLFSHLLKAQRTDPVKLDERGVLEVMDACTGCHRDEYKSWLSGGHSATYSDIFLNADYNSMERPYPDCFRCHGMYYKGTVEDLVEPISTKGPWHLTDERQAPLPVVPCLACHPIHMENETMGRAGSLDDPEAIFYERESREPLMGLYLRSDRMHLRADQLPKPAMYRAGEEVYVSDDPTQHLCMQCHAPNWVHEVGTEDDRTPVGVHEGISCLACHLGHSNNARESCKNCHPALSNCGLDVETMNTTYASRESPHDIHFVQCTDCHDPVPNP